MSKLIKTVMASMIAALVVMPLAGCQSVSDVTPVGQDTYFVGAQVRGGLTSWAEVKQLAIGKAANFCAGQGRRMTVVSTDTHGTQGFTPQSADVTFRCDPS